MIDRRVFIRALASSVVATPFWTGAQQATRVARIALLSPYSAQTTVRWYDAFRQNLRTLGWIEGNDVEFLYRHAEGHLDRLPSFADEMVRLDVSVIVTSVTADTLAARAATRTIPIVMTAVGDPIDGGFVASLARPGGNATGLTQMAPELGGKRLQLLREIVPNVALVAVLRDGKNPHIAAELAGSRGICAEAEDAVAPAGRSVCGRFRQRFCEGDFSARRRTCHSARPIVRQQRAIPRRPCHEEQSTRGLSPARIRRRRRAHCPWAGPGGHLSPCSRLRRQDSERAPKLPTSRSSGPLSSSLSSISKLRKHSASRSLRHCCCARTR